MKPGELCMNVFNTPLELCASLDAQTEPIGYFENNRLCIIVSLCRSTQLNVLDTSDRFTPMALVLTDTMQLGWINAGYLYALPG